MNLFFMCMPGGSEAKREVESSEARATQQLLCFRSLLRNWRMGVKPTPTTKPIYSQSRSVHPKSAYTNYISMKSHINKICS